MTINRPYKTIIIDDEEPARLHIKKLASDFSDILQIEAEAENGEQAIEMIDRLKPDLIFLDIRMPGMDGLETAKRIREMCASKGNAAPFMLAMTAYAMKGDRERMLRGGMDAYLAKPFAWEDLAAIIATSVRDRGV